MAVVAKPSPCIILEGEAARRFLNKPRDTSAYDRLMERAEKSAPSFMQKEVKVRRDDKKL